ncbi:MAG: hypothetical protein HY763_09315 [Planctomycetes bacterium]|nr:hypothetical protein [Planctomycetota bacterium]
MYESVCDALGHDDFIFRFSPSEPEVPEKSRGYSISLDRQEGRGGFRIAIEQLRPNQPVRLLMEFNWPPSEMHVHERFDMSCDAVFNALQGNWQRVLAEARIRSQCQAGTCAAMDFIKERLLSSPDRHASAFGAPLSFASLALHVWPGAQTQDSLASPRQELTVEPLREDPHELYLELMAQWSQVPVGGQPAELTVIRQIDRKPSEYVSAARDSLARWVRTFAGD